MKYGSIYSKDNIENKYNYSSTGGRRSSQNNFETSHDHHTHSTLNTDGLLRSSSGTGYHSSGSSIKNSGKPSTKKSSSQNKPDTKSQKRQTSGGRALTYHERKKKEKTGMFSLPSFNHSFNCRGGFCIPFLIKRCILQNRKISFR